MAVAQQAIGNGNRLSLATSGLTTAFRRLRLALARGKKVHDKRETVKERDWKREQQRLLRRSA